MKTRTARGVAATVIASGVILPTPAAHAGPNCAVAGPHLNIHHSTGYDVTVDANGASLGPTAQVRAPGGTTQWSVNNGGGITGRSVDFLIMSGKAYVHFTGTVGNDGFAHGTSTEIGSPVLLAAGPWDSTTPLTC